LYAANGGNSGGFFACLDVKTGKTLWDQKTLGKGKGLQKGSLAYADGRLYYYTEDTGEVLLIEPSGKELIVKGRFTQPDRSKSNAWAHPVIANGKLIIRDQENMFCYDIKAK